jgi:hypothetical protein
LPDHLFDHLEPKIQFLNLAGNTFTEVPKALKSLKQHLILLNLSANQLSDLNEDLMGFPNLEVLNLAGNQLTHLPEFLGQQEKLGYLVVEDNPLLDEELPQTLWMIPQVELGRDQNRLTHGMPFPLERFSKRFAEHWPSIQKEEGALSFKLWLFKLGAILIAGEIPGQKEYFSHVLSKLMDDMMDHPGMRQHCFSYSEEVVAHCEDKVLFSVFFMQTARVEENILQGHLSPAEVKTQLARMFCSYRMQEKSIQYLGQLQKLEGRENTQEDESVETALDFLLNIENDLDMPVERNQMKQFYKPVSKATPLAIRQAVQEIRQESQQVSNLILFACGQKFC